MFNTFNQPVKNQQGLTLIELMMTMILGLLLMSLIIDMYLMNQRNGKLIRALYQLQRNAKDAIEILKEDIRSAGYIGCALLSRDFPIVTQVPYVITPNNTLTNSHANELTVRRASAYSVSLQKPMMDKLTLYTSADNHFSKGDILLISDCKKAEIFLAKMVMLTKEGQIITSQMPLQQHFSPYAEVSLLQVNKYFVAKSHYKNSDGTFKRALFKEDIQGRKQELVDGIEQMSVAYTLKNANGQIIEVNDKKMDDSAGIVGVTIKLTLFSAPITKTWYSYVSL